MTRLRVATYNVHGMTGLDGSRRPERNLEVLRRLDADYIGVQEFVNWPSHAGKHLLEHWCESLGMQEWRYAPAFERGGHIFGNALFSRYPLLDCREHDFSAPGCHPRLALHARTTVEDTAIHLTVVHLGVRARARTVQRPLLAKLIESAGEAVHVVLGDFNEWHVWNRTFQMMKTAFNGGPVLPTFPAIAPALALDRIWVRPRGSLVSIHVDALPPAKMASDHLPLVAVVEVGA